MLTAASEMGSDSQRMFIHIIYSKDKTEAGKLRSKRDAIAKLWGGVRGVSETGSGQSMIFLGIQKSDGDRSSSDGGD